MTVAGLSLSFGLTPLLSSLSFGVRPISAFTLASVSVFVLFVALIAVLVPTVRVLRNNPNQCTEVRVTWVVS